VEAQLSTLHLVPLVVGMVVEPLLRLVATRLVGIQFLLEKRAGLSGRKGFCVWRLKEVKSRLLL